MTKQKSPLLEVESLNWDSTLRTLTLSKIEQQYGKTAKDLAELVELIVEAKGLFSKELKNGKITGVGFSSEIKKRKMYINNEPTDMTYDYGRIYCLSQGTYKIVIRIHYSMQKLKRVLKNIIGDNAASNFYDHVRDTIEYGTIGKNHYHDDERKLVFCGDEFQDGKTKIERILMDLEEWHERAISKPAISEKGKGRTIKDSKKAIVKNICDYIENKRSEIPPENKWAFLVDKFNYPYKGKKNERRGESLKVFLKKHHPETYKHLQ
jgi:hypothetical protein